MIGPGRLGGRPNLNAAFLEALLDQHVRISGPSGFARRLFSRTVRLRTFRPDGAIRTYPFDPVLRKSILEAFPSSSEARVRSYAVRAVREGVVYPYLVNRGARTVAPFPGVPSVDQVIELSFESLVPPVR